MSKKVKTYHLDEKLIDGIKKLAKEMTKSGDFKIYESGLVEIAMKEYISRHTFPDKLDKPEITNMVGEMYPFKKPKLK